MWITSSFGHSVICRALVGLKLLWYLMMVNWPKDSVETVNRCLFHWDLISEKWRFTETFVSNKNACCFGTIVHWEVGVLSTCSGDVCGRLQVYPLYLILRRLNKTVFLIPEIRFGPRELGVQLFSLMWSKTRVKIFARGKNFCIKRQLHVHFPTGTPNYQRSTFSRSQELCPCLEYLSA